MHIVLCSKEPDAYGYLTRWLREWAMLIDGLIGVLTFGTVTLCLWESVSMHRLRRQLEKHKARRLRLRGE